MTTHGFNKIAQPHFFLYTIAGLTALQGISNLFYLRSPKKMPQLSTTSTGCYKTFHMQGCNNEPSACASETRAFPTISQHVQEG
jgi:hypothetical protein